MSADSDGGQPSRRAEIIALARRTFAERGYTNTSMRDIAESAGVLAGSLYSHFRSKSEILQLVLEPWLEQMVPTQEAALRSEGTGLERLRRMMGEVLVLLAQYGDEITILHYGWSDLAELEDLVPIVERANRLLDLWHDVIIIGRRDGSIRADVEPELLVRAITSSLHATVDTRRYGMRPAPLGLASVEELSHQLIDIFVEGVAAPLTTSGPKYRAQPAAAVEGTGGR